MFYGIYIRYSSDLKRVTNIVEVKSVTMYTSVRTSFFLMYSTQKSVIDLCEKKKKITTVRVYEIELKCDALFV